MVARRRHRTRKKHTQHINFDKGTKMKENIEKNIKNEEKANKDSKTARYLCCIYGNSHMTYKITVAQKNYSVVDTMGKHYVTHHIIDAQKHIKPVAS